MPGAASPGVLSAFEGLGKEDLLEEFRVKTTQEPSSKTIVIFW